MSGAQRFSPFVTCYVKSSLYILDFLNYHLGRERCDNLMSLENKITWKQF